MNAQEQVSGTVIVFLWTPVGTKRALQPQTTYDLVGPKGLAERTAAIHRSPQRRQLGLRLRCIDLLHPVRQTPQGPGGRFQDSFVSRERFQAPGTSPARFLVPQVGWRQFRALRSRGRVHSRRTIRFLTPFLPPSWLQLVLPILCFFQHHLRRRANFRSPAMFGNATQGIRPRFVRIQNFRKTGTSQA